MLRIVLEAVRILCVKHDLHALKSSVRNANARGATMNNM
jgi:hypothetical protein